ncbi:MAG: DnaA N-terminal domain-containing protein, partial [Rickettsiaceae bacterium]|nr:DnaA N-terminal domain-containing protein [Rickettsiaceae bacterium]
VKEIGKLNLEGNIVPIEWFSHLKQDSGKPDTVAILLLSDIVYWYRPTTIRNETSGKVISYRKKFKSDLLQRCYKDFESLFGFSEKQIREALIRLESIGVIERVFRHIEVNGKKLPNVMFIRIFPEKVSHITNKHSFLEHTEDISLQGTISFPTGNHILPHGEPYPSPQGNTNTKTTTKTTTNTLSQTSDDTKNSNEKEMIIIWNKIIDKKDNDRKLTKFRSDRLKEILTLYFEDDLKKWEAFCSLITKSDFLMGKVTKFKIMLDWALKEENFTKLIEGDYGLSLESLRNTQFQEARSELTKIELEEDFNNLTNQEKILRTSLKNQLGEAIYNSWFRNVQILPQEKNLRCICKSNFIRDYLRNNYIKYLNIAVKLAYGVATEVLVDTHDA